MKKNIDIDTVVIGGGPSGYSAAFRCSDLGFSTIIIEKENTLGGTCLNYGCIPSKSLLHLTSLIREIQEFKKFGINLIQNNHLNIQSILKWKDNIVFTLSKGLQKLAENRNVKVIKGTAKFLTNNSISVETENISYIVNFKNAILAIGSIPIKLPNIPMTDPRIWNSTDALSLKSIPKNLLIIGAGIIGLEMASIYSALGSKIDVIERSNYFFSSIDVDVSNFLFKKISNYFDIHMNCEIIDIVLQNQGILVTRKNSNNIQNQKLYDNILVATGRIPNLDAINYIDIGIELNSFGFIKVDKQLRTNISNIFAIGDVIGQPMLAHKGIHEANIVAEVISGKNYYFEPNAIPSVAYCYPEVAWTGIMECTAKKLGINYATSVVPWNISGRAYSSNCADSGLTKLIISKKTNKIIGGIIIGKHAGELISNINLSIEMGCDIEDMELTINPHPTLSETLNIAAQLYNGTAIDLINKV